MKISVNINSTTVFPFKKKMAEHVSVAEIETEAKKLKRDLEGWREVILPLNSILLWEKNSYLGCIVGASTLAFLFFWHLDPSILTTISFLGLIITVVDYGVPALTQQLSRPDSWTSAKERKLENICKSLAANKLYFIKVVKSFYQMRKDRPKLYYVIVIVSLLFLSWIGNAVNNLFLSYLIVTSLLLLPGVQHRGIINKYTSSLQGIISNFFRASANLKSD